MRITIQVKLFLLTFGISLAIISGIVTAVTLIQTATIEEKISRDFLQTQNVFKQAQSLRYDRLVESAYLISENSLFKANVELADPASVYFSVEEFSRFMKADLFFVTDKSGKLLAFLGDPSRHEDDFSRLESVSNSLKGQEPDVTTELPLLLAVGSDTLYQIVTVPIFTANDNRILGTTTLGSRLTEVEAKQLKGNTGIDISFFVFGKALASTLNHDLEDDLNRLYQELSQEITGVLNELKPSQIIETTLDGEAHFVFFAPLGTGANGCFMASVKKSSELAILITLRNIILWIALATLLVAGILSIVTGRYFTRPILILSEAMKRVGEGNLNVSVKPSSADEIGLLTDRFNSMIIGLRERMQLSRYVGSHTLEMIQKAAESGKASEGILGGRRQEITMLFSDIRGFTAYSEQRSPEEVIEMLNRYLGFQADLVTRYGGSVDKFVGDEMVALFAGSDSLKRALDCAYEIQKQKGEERQKRPEDRAIDIGIGINAGSVVLGNMGAQNRMDYTVIGSAVNLTARLCSAANGGEILIPYQLLKNLDLPVNQIPESIIPMQFKGIYARIDIAVLKAGQSLKSA